MLLVLVIFMIAVAGTAIATMYFMKCMYYDEMFGVHEDIGSQSMHKNTSESQSNANATLGMGTPTWVPEPIKPPVFNTSTTNATVGSSPEEPVSTFDFPVLTLGVKQPHPQPAMPTTTNETVSRSSNDTDILAPNTTILSPTAATNVSSSLPGNATNVTSLSNITAIDPASVASNVTSLSNITLVDPASVTLNATSATNATSSMCNASLAVAANATNITLVNTSALAAGIPLTDGSNATNATAMSNATATIVNTSEAASSVLQDSGNATNITTGNNTSFPLNSSDLLAPTTLKSTLNSSVFSTENSSSTLSNTSTTNATTQTALSLDAPSQAPSYYASSTQNNTLLYGTPPPVHNTSDFSVTVYLTTSADKLHHVNNAPSNASHPEPETSQGSIDTMALQHSMHPDTAFEDGDELSYSTAVVSDAPSSVPTLQPTNFPSLVPTVIPTYNDVLNATTAKPSTAVSLTASIINNAHPLHPVPLVESSTNLTTTESEVGTNTSVPYYSHTDFSVILPWMRDRQYHP
jgi:hypothetical protein